MIPVANPTNQSTLGVVALVAAAAAPLLGLEGASFSLKVSCNWPDSESSWISLNKAIFNSKE